MADTRVDHIDLIRNLTGPVEPLPTGYPTRFGRLKAGAVIFDIYGTLLASAAGDVGVDAAEDDEQALCQALEDGGWQGAGPATGRSGVGLLQSEITREHEVLKGQGVEYPEVDILEIWQRVLARLQMLPGPGRSVRRLGISYECRTNPVWPMPGLDELLRVLQGRDLQLGILSNAQFYTPLLFQAFLGQTPDLLGFVADLSLWSYREGEGKPSPNLFQRMDDRLAARGIVSGDVVYVGNDMLKDIWPAVRVGWKTVLFAGDSRSLRLREGDERVASVRPDRVIDDLGQLLQILE